jgi:hypothetical protein
MINLFDERKNLFNRWAIAYMENFPNYGIEPEFNLKVTNVVCTQKYDFRRDLSNLMEDVRRKLENG